MESDETLRGSKVVAGRLGFRGQVTGRVDNRAMCQVTGGYGCARGMEGKPVGDGRGLVGNVRPLNPATAWLGLGRWLVGWRFHPTGRWASNFPGE